MGIFVFFIITAIIIFFVIGYIVSNRSVKSKLENKPLPAKLGIQLGIAKPISDRLNAAFPKVYENNVKKRVLVEHPKAKDYEVDWAMLELKRYFVMNSLLREVPMFSEKADEIWHEMLMFTKDYEQFSQKFFNSYLHHIPNMEQTPIPGERAFFDWMYIILFKVENNSEIIWNKFLRHPIKKEILDDFAVMDDKQLLRKYFRQDDEWLDVKLSLINRLKNEIKNAERQETPKLSLDKKARNKHEVYVYALGAAVFYSIHETDMYEDHMSEMLPQEMMMKGNGGGSGNSSCSGFGCSSSSDNDGGGSSGGSSCSSCGGGCSS